MFRPRLLLLALTLGMALLPAACAVAANESISLQEHGKLNFAVPDGWSMKVMNTQPNQPPVLEFAPKDGDALRMHVVVLWTKQPDTQYNRPDAIRTLMQRACDSQLFTATERECTLKELHGSAGTGFWYALSDRAPQPGDFQFMLRGDYPVGPLLLDFTALGRSTLRDGNTQILGILSGATLQSDQQP